MKIAAIVPAAGIGKRLGCSTAKPFVKIKSKPILAYTLKTLNDSSLIDGIILVADKDNIRQAESLVRKYAFSKVLHIVKGGATRQQSVKNALTRLSEDAGLVVIHDGARPCLSGDILTKAIKEALRCGAVCVCAPVKPTMKRARGKWIIETPDRSELWEAQTPQIFRKDILIRAYKNKNLCSKATDDSTLVEALGRKVKIVEGDYSNIKITTKEDLILAEKILENRE